MQNKTPIYNSMKEWIENPCHGRIAAVFEFAAIIEQIRKLELEYYKLKSVNKFIAAEKSDVSI